MAALEVAHPPTPRSSLRRQFTTRAPNFATEPIGKGITCGGDPASLCELEDAVSLKMPSTSGATAIGKSGEFGNLPFADLIDGGDPG